jgi:TetR/AcrR family transcriptional repressor of nem operon
MSILRSEMTDSADSRPADPVLTRPGKRERLLGAAADLLYRQGVEKTTLADIAQAADVALGNIYYYFKTKDAM